MNKKIIKPSNIKVKSINSSLKKIDVSSTIYDTHAVTVISQELQNESLKSLEIGLSFSLREDLVLKSFVAKIGKKVLKSKVYDKEKAKEKYSDSISQGNTAIYGELREDSEEDYILTIGNLLPGEKIIIDVEIIHQIKTEDLSYRFCFPLKKIPKIIVDKEIMKPHYLYNRNEKLREIEIQQNVISYVTMNFNALYLSPSKITRLTSIYHKSEISFSDDNKIANLKISEEELILNENSEIIILYKNEDLNTPRLYEEYDGTTKKYSYMLNYLIDDRIYKNNLTTPDTDKNNNYNQIYDEDAINDTSASFIFLLDQSGSMNGSPINTAKEALILFLKSLPPFSEFQIIGFGSNYEDYTGLLKYDQNNVDKAIKIISSLSSNLGGTYIYQPLEFIFKQTNYNPKLSKNIFLLTDGIVDNSDLCVNMIRTNSNNFRVHALGIGQYVSRSFIRQCGVEGKGTFDYAVEMNEITKKVINSLNFALKFYFTDIKIEFSQDIMPLLQYPNLNSFNYVYKDETISYSFITNEKIDSNSFITLSAKSNLKDKFIEKKINVAECIFSLGENNLLNKYIAGFVCKKNTETDLNVIKKISKFYQVISKETSLFAALENSYGNMTEMVTSPVINIISKPQNISSRILHKGLINASLGIKRSMKMSAPMSYNPNLSLYGNKSNNFIKSSASLNTKNKQKPSQMNYLLQNESLDRSRKKKMMPKIQSNNDIHFEKESESLECDECDEDESSGISIQNNLLSINLSSDNNKLEFSEIINTQKIEGNWSILSDNSGLLKKLEEKFKSKLLNLTINLEEKSISYQNDDLITILIIWYLFNNYSDKKDEFFLITNKAKKYLLNKGINFKDYNNVFN